MIGRQAVAERGRGAFPFTEGLEKIGDLVDESMLVSDLQSGHPPAFHVGVIAVGDVNATPAAEPAFIAMIENLDAMQVVEVPHGGSTLAVDFQRVQGLVA